MVVRKQLPVVIFIIITVFSISVYGQTYQLTSTNKKALKFYSIAENAFRSRENMVAESALIKSVKADKNFIEAWLLLGDVYTDLKKVDKAINAYESAIQIDSAFFPRVYYFLGNLHFEKGEYLLACRNFEDCLKFNPKSATSERVRLNLEESRLALHSVKNPINIDIENVGRSINSASDDYINFVSADNSELVLTRKEALGIDERNRTFYSETFYQSSKANSLWSTPETLNLDWSDGLNLGGMNMSVDGRKMYFTGCGWQSGFGSCDLFVSYRNGKKWEAPTNLGTRVNSQWWDSQPMVSADGKHIFFSSRRPGGKGGSDIWMTIRLKNGKWSPPVNLGDSINTSGNEMAPFLHADGRTMYFSSDGHFGMGKSDLFITRMDETGRWSKAKNLGYPVNTNHNEINIFITIAGTRSWISSDRPGGEGNFDIYSFGVDDSFSPGNVEFVKGFTIDSQTLMKLSATVVLTNLKTGLMEDETVSDPTTGEFLMVLQHGINYAFNISREGYMLYSENFNLSDSIQTKSIEKEFFLTPLLSAKRLILNNVFFDFNKARLKTESFAELDQLVLILLNNPELKIKIGGHTDNIGDDKYNLDLSEKRAKSVYDFLIENKIGPDRLTYQGYGSEKPIETNETEEGRAINRRTEIEIID